MNVLIHVTQEQLVKEAVGLVGGVVFFGSWVLQAWQSRRAGVPVVSQSFFVLRAVASALLAAEGIRTQSLSITLVMTATLVLMLYNIYLVHKKHRC